MASLARNHLGILFEMFTFLTKMQIHPFANCFSSVKSMGVVPHFGNSKPRSEGFRLKLLEMGMGRNS